MAGVVVLDASALIALHDSRDRHHAWARQMFIDTVDASLVMSTLTYAEVLVHPTRAGKLREFQDSVSGLGIDVRGVSPESATDIASLRAQTALKMPDVIVLCQAQALGASVATTDRALANEASEQGLVVLSPHPA